VNRKNTIGILFIVILACAIGYIAAFLTPRTISRTRAAMTAAATGWNGVDGKQTNEQPPDDRAGLSLDELLGDWTPEQRYLHEIARLTRELDQATIELGDSIMVINSLRAQLEESEERSETAIKLAETVIQYQLSRPPLMLRPTPAEPEPIKKTPPQQPIQDAVIAVSP